MVDFLERFWGTSFRMTLGVIQRKLISFLKNEVAFNNLQKLTSILSAHLGSTLLEKGDTGIIYYIFI